MAPVIWPSGTTMERSTRAVSASARALADRMMIHDVRTAWAESWRAAALAAAASSPSLSTSCDSRSSTAMMWTRACAMVELPITRRSSV
jgi:hypothetical protein